MMFQGRHSDGRRKRLPVAIAAQTAWFFHTDRSFRSWSIVAAASLTFSVVTWPRTLPALLLAALFTVASATQWVLSWKTRERDAEGLGLRAAAPVTIPYESPYDNWEDLDLYRSGGGDVLHRGITNTTINRRLWYGEDITVRVRSRWLPTGRAAAVREVWGGKRYNLNEGKIRLSSDLTPATQEVDLQVTDYNAYIVTNNLALQSLWRNDHPILSFEEVGIQAGRIPRLGASPLSNHLGGDLLVIEPGRVLVQEQSGRNLVFPYHLTSTASGSFDAPRDTRGAVTLTDIVKRGLARELREELGLTELANTPPDDIVVTGFFRATYTGGKPQFTAVARTPRLNPNATERYIAGTTSLEFSTAEGIAGLTTAIEEFQRVPGRLLSPPLRAGFLLLDAWLQGAPDAETWLAKYW